MNLIYIIIAFFLMLPIVYFVWMHGARLNPRDADALIVLGFQCKNEIPPLLRERLETAVFLLNVCNFKSIILSGGAVLSETSEADIMKKFFVERSIPPEKILIEDKSVNTVQNLVNCKRLMEQHRLHSCLLVTNSFHIRRVKYIMSKLNTSADYFARRTPTAILRQWKMTFLELRAFRHSVSWFRKI